MTEEDKLVLQQNTGAAAKRELEALGSAFDDARKEFTTAWLGTEPRDDKGREKLWLATTVVTRVESILRQRVANGTIAEKELERLRRAGEPRKIFSLP